jgi:hypothetical protein
MSHASTITSGGLDARLSKKTKRALFQKFQLPPTSVLQCSNAEPMGDPVGFKANARGFLFDKPQPRRVSLRHSTE